MAACVAPAPLIANEAVGPGAFAAIVRDAAGKPVADALVVADGPTRRSVTTGVTGIATLMALPRGTYVLSVTRAGYRTVLQSLTIGPGADTIRNLSLRLAAENLAGAADGQSTISPATAVADEPYAAPFVVTDLDASIVPDRTARPTVLLLETSPNDSRFELDGIPLPSAPGGGSQFARDALATTAIDVEPSLVLAPLDTPRDAIGGVVDVRTAPIAVVPTGGMQLGYDGRFGNFQRVAYSQTLGPFGFATDDVTGGGMERSQSVKFAYAPSATTTLGFAAYGAQSQSVTSGVPTTTSEPVYAANLHTTLGRATFDAREYRSELTNNVLGDAYASNDARIAGTQLALSVPFGENVASFGYDRRRETSTLDETSAAAAYATVDARADLALGRAVRLELGDDYSSGSASHRRHDPHAALSFGTSDRLRVRLSATSAFATAASAPLAAPETSFGYRASVESRLLRTGRVWIAADEIRRRDAFALQTDARSQGVEAGFSRTAVPGTLGLLAFARIARATAFGAAQPFARSSLAATDELDASRLKARVALEYRTRDGLALGVGTTLLGRGNALAPGALVLGDADVALPLGDAAQVRFGVRNAFGHAVASPFATTFAPRTITVTFGRR